MQSPALSAACPACPVETTLTLISDKWKVLILRAWSTPSPTWGAASGLFWTPWKPGEKPTKKMPADAGVFSLNGPLLSDQ